eukprot:4306921-Amphidinium_carterae.1
MIIIDQKEKEQVNKIELRTPPLPGTDHFKKVSEKCLSGGGRRGFSPSVNGCRQPHALEEIFNAEAKEHLWEAEQVPPHQ